MYSPEDVMLLMRTYITYQLLGLLRKSQEEESKYELSLIGCFNLYICIYILYLFKLHGENNYSGTLMYSPEDVMLLMRTYITYQLLGLLRKSQEEENILHGKVQIVFCSPEMIVKKPWRRMLTSTTYKDRLAIVAFDEMHCVATWPNIYLDVILKKPGEGIEKHIDEYIRELGEQKQKARKSIIYCSSIKITSEIYITLINILLQQGLSKLPAEKLVDQFHSALDKDTADVIVNEFLKADSHIRCLVSTVAFGMGMSVNDIEIIYHWGPSQNAMNYWQEVGRAGRDGRSSQATLLINQNMRTEINKHKGQFPPVHTQHFQEDILSYCKVAIGKKDCLRRNLLGNFIGYEGGEERDCSVICNCKTCCCNCSGSCGYTD
ncbi:bifunctional 3'-5' exonuclease/ATP-dependent helicase WRN-like isoform X1 [Lineus longissimus]|uniref:bifunctional 3'-5' exonuclease/ATP-dependent helicase WRN-like isoform X1 n=1 Tax=Lineus longissimus TaxID=88925 RepID=UPI00315CC402